MMYKILVADDEYYARKALVMMLEKADLPIEIMGDFEDGQEIVNYLETKKADIVITDIKMPTLDGLDVAAYIKEHHLNTDVVLETGYEDFQYALKALRYGVKEYLTKPINEQELVICMERLMNERENLEEEKEKGMMLDHILSHLSFLQVLEIKELREKLIGKEKEHPFYYIMVSGEMSDKCYEKWSHMIKRGDSFGVTDSWYFREKKEYVMIAAVSEQFDFSKDENLLVTARWKHCLDSQSWLGISGIHYGLGELSQAYRECAYAINERILTGEHLLFWKNTMDFSNLLKKEKEDLFFYAISKGKLSDAEKVVDSLFEICTDEKENIYSLYNGIIKLFSEMRRFYYQKIEGQNTPGNYFLFDFKVDLHQFHNQEELKKYIKMILREVAGVPQETENTFLIDDLISYLEIHYSNDITLNELAEHKYFVSAGHLSRLFKAKTGMNFSKYLMSLRMKKAEEYLENTDFDITDIASLTGYNDVSHFTQTFRKNSGMTPSEFRGKKRKQKSYKKQEK